MKNNLIYDLYLIALELEKISNKMKDEFDDLINDGWNGL